MTLFQDYLVDGVPVIAPDAGVNLTRTDLDSSETGRDQSGFMHRILMRSRVRTWELHYAHMTAQEYEYMCRLFEGKDVFRFTFTENGKTNTAVCYCSGDSITYQNAVSGMYSNYKLKIIEC